MPGWERRKLWQELEPMADLCGQLEVQTERMKEANQPASSLKYERRQVCLVSDYCLRLRGECTGYAEAASW